MLFLRTLTWEPDQGRLQLAECVAGKLMYSVSYAQSCFFATELSCNQSTIQVF